MSWGQAGSTIHCNEGRLTGFITCCVGTSSYNTILNKRQEWEDEEEDASSYWTTLRKAEPSGT